MAKSFHQLSPRAQFGVFGALCALTLGASWQVLLSPQHVEVSTRRDKLGALEEEVARAQAMAGRLPTAQREVLALETSLRETEAIIPEEKDPQDVLRNLHELASESLLDIASFNPKPVAVKTQYTEWPIELGMEGSYHDLGRFFDRIAAMSRLMSVTDLQIRTKVKPTSRGSVSATCVATTFVFQKAQPALPAGGQK